MTLTERMKRRIKIFGADSLSSDERDMLAALEAADAMAEALHMLEIDVGMKWGDPHTLDESREALAAYRAATKEPTT